MPTDTIVIVAAVLALFCFFAAVVTYTDLTWEPKRLGRRTER